MPPGRAHARFALAIPRQHRLRFEPGGHGALPGCADALTIVSMHSSKGLKFGLALIPNLDEMPRRVRSTNDCRISGRQPDASR